MSELFSSSVHVCGEVIVSVEERHLSVSESILEVGCDMTNSKVNGKYMRT